MDIATLADGQKARVDFDIQWATVSTYDPNVVEPQEPGELPLFSVQEEDAELDDAIPF